MIFLHPASLFISGFILFVGSDSFAAGIERPAGIIDSKVSNVSGLRIESSKSKVVPIKRTLTIANGPKNQIKSKSNLTVSQTKSAQMDSKNPPATETLESDAWDSAARRFDQHDPAISVTKGVRVEDIIEPTSEYRYVAGRRKNPFVPEVIRGRSTKQKELDPNDVEIPIINPLQSFDVKQLAVIGVWESSDNGWKALIQTPTNQGIETKLGDPAGNSGGRIMSISPDAVVVREFSVRADGTREYRDIPLYMGSDKPSAESGQIGGRLILKPGATTPEIESPDPSKKPMTSLPTLVPSSVPGTLTSIVPVEPPPTLPPDGLMRGVSEFPDANSGTGRVPSLMNPSDISIPASVLPSATPSPQGGLP